jgi:hypothetical protein
MYTLKIDSKMPAVINEQLKITKKAIVSLGCSFVHGIGAWSPDLVEQFPPVFKDGHLGYTSYDDGSKMYISKKWPDTFVDPISKDLNTDHNIVNNAFVSVLANKYLNGEWTPINMGEHGAGNFSAISRLHMYPVNWKDAEEIIVVYCPTGPERFDFIKETSDYTLIGNDFTTAWIQWSAKNQAGDYRWRQLHDSYRECIWSRKFECMNIIMQFQYLKTWCELHNAKLIVFPAFNRDEYTPEHFTKELGVEITRNAGNRLITKQEPITYDLVLQEAERRLKMVPWQNFVKFQGQTTFWDLAFSQEIDFDKELGMHEFVGEKGGSREGWIMKCGHPSAKAHDLLAKELYNHLIETDFCKQQWTPIWDNKWILT